MDRSPQWIDGARWGFRQCIAHLTAEAKTMNSPHAKGLLNGAAAQLGKLKHQRLGASKQGKEPAHD